MPIINICEEVRDVYKQAAGRRWVIPCFCSENLTTTEAILSAAQEFAVENGYKSIPVTVAITVRYSHRAQSENYTHTQRWDTGLKLFCADVEVLSSANGPFPNVDVLIHLDHVQHDEDIELFSWDLSWFSSIMYDASTLPFTENIRKTSEFVGRMKDIILIEGACDEIFDASGGKHNALTTPECAKRYYTETGVDLLVANLGTEHRATAQVLHYYGDIAQKIRDEIGYKIVLHGLSSVSLSQVKNLYNDGICKVNIWTMLERDASKTLLEEMKINADKITGSKAAISHFTTLYRQDIVYNKMKDIVRSFLDMWYI
ncbi:MAG: class II fructose-bisphosphate aldolase [Oscillospiraceae bacterium]|nr:class II fructose-bisphosphate aldolase [Oscillospiraceae bacterium]